MRLKISGNSVSLHSRWNSCGQKAKEGKVRIVFLKAAIRSPGDIGMQSGLRVVRSARPELKLVRGVATLCLALGLALSGSKVLASERSSERVVARMMDSISALFQEAELQSEIIDGLETSLGKHTDIELIARAAIGQAWRQADRNQRQEFIRVFQRYLAEKYAQHLPEAMVGTYEIVEIRKLKKNNYEVLSSVVLSGTDNYEITWFTRVRNGRTRIVNMVTSEFNLLSLERKVIRSLLQQRGGNLDELIRYLPTRYN